ncbi:MAG: hypothetical protein KQH53_15230 [Desulfarculaceae bacterium]|nr:hypothetical protein [Desulfarculaceae bacterium]
MAEIKSALEIALERAAALGAGEDDSRREAEEQGRALARRLLEGEAPAAELTALEPGPARQGAARALLEALSDDRAEALDGLRVLAGEAGEGAWQAVARALDQRAEAREALHAELAAEMSGELAGLRIGGPALRPNPLAHPDHAARASQALSGPQAALRAAGDELLAAL